MTWVREPNAEPIAGYRLIEPIGSGGFGEVWKCEAPGGIHKAMKFVYGNLNSLDVDAVRAEQELNALQRIKEVRHPFICSLDRIEIVGGELVIVMELAEKTLHDLFQECLSAGMIGIPRDSLLRYLRDTAEALDHMNEKHKLQHLDVKPRNLFVICDRVKVADFGLVKHLERLGGSGMLSGVTPLYAPPETFHGRISERSDQYSLAIVYQELLTGHRPFNGKNVRQLAQQHMQEEPDLRALPEIERPVVHRALSKDPNKRFPSCMTFVRALFNARTVVQSRAAQGEAAALVGANISMADTMEEMLMQASPTRSRQREEPDDDSVDLGGPMSGLDADNLAVSQAGLTVAQPDTGALRPTLFIGLGGFGRKALLELRCRFVDRFGDLSKVPLLRFLCIDTDAEAVNMAVRGAPEVALSRTEVYHLPLQQVTSYRRRILEQLAEWLPREKLYAMPRSLQPQGSRALGRLAFVDNQQRLVARLRREIQEATTPEVLYQSVSQTGLALRDNVPRVYILSSAGGGSSGMLTDLGYAIRRQLAQLRHPDAAVNLLLLCGSPNDPASPKSEQANIYATLTEINHYSDPGIPFTAQYGIEGQRLVDNGAPFSSVYLLPLAHRGPDVLSDVVSHLGSYLFHEVTTPLAVKLEQTRRASGDSSTRNVLATPFRSFGTYAIWFPRGLLLRCAARLACRKLIENWLATDKDGLSPAVLKRVQTASVQLTADPMLAPAALQRRLEEVSLAANTLDLHTTPSEMVTSLLVSLQEQVSQNVAQEDPVSWARQAMTRVRDCVGSVEQSGEMHEWRKTRITRSLQAAAQKVAEECLQSLIGNLYSVMEHPGERVAAAEHALTLLQAWTCTASDAQQQRLEQLRAKSQQCWTQVERALQDCATGGGGFRLFGGRSPRKLLQAFVEALSAYGRQRLSEEGLAALCHLYGALHGKLGEQRRDVGFCRQRLKHMEENLDAALPSQDEDVTSTRTGGDLTVSRTPTGSTDDYWQAIRQSGTARVLLPDNEQDLERAAVRFLHRLNQEHWVQLDKDLHERVLQPRGGLHRACMTSAELTRALAAPLMDETIHLLSEHLPIMDVAQILSEEFGLTGAGGQAPAARELVKHTRTYLERAVPLLAQTEHAREDAFLLVPASDAGRILGDALARALPELKQVKVPGQADLMFCRDNGPLTMQDMQRIFSICRQAFEGLANAPQSSPHARFDIIDWLPLDP